MVEGPAPAEWPVVAWWALPGMDVARYMLNQAPVRSGAMGMGTAA